MTPAARLLALPIGLLAACSSLLGVDDIVFYNDAAGASGSGGGGMGGAAGHGAEAGGGGGAGGNTAGSGGALVCDSAAISTAHRSGAPCTPATLAAASDTFDGGANGWCTLERALDPASAIDASDGEVVIRSSCSQWHQQGFGPFLYRRIQAPDFVVVTRVTISDDDGGPLMRPFHGGGILVRAPKDPPGQLENHFLWQATLKTGQLRAIGWATEDAVSTEIVNLETPPSSWLALCRAAGNFYFFTRQSIWFPIQEAQHIAALEQDVEVGIVANAFDGGAVAKARFEQLLFGEPVPATSAGCLSAIKALAP